MPVAESVVGQWFGHVAFAGQCRPIAMEVSLAADGLKASWEADAIGGTDIEIAVDDEGVVVRSTNFKLVHEGPVVDQMDGQLLTDMGVHLGEATFQLRRDESAYLPFARPRVDEQLAPVTSSTLTPGQTLPNGWPLGSLTPAEAAQVEALVAEVLTEEHQICDGFMLLRGGSILAEEYFYGTTADSLHPVQSVTKSVTALLCGIARDQGNFPALDTRVIDLYPEHADSVWAQGGYPITVHHVLSMSAGVEWDEGSTNYTDARNTHSFMNLSPDWVRFVLDQPAVQAPGKGFVYSSGLSVLMGDILRRCVGDVATFAETHLFGPLGISDYHWMRLKTGGHQTGGGLSLRMRDMAKIGQLVLQRGIWEGRQVIPAEWVDTCLTVHSLGGDPPRLYGYQWWRATTAAAEPAEPTIWSGYGWGGQRIHVIPSADAIIVHTGSNYTRDTTELDRRLATYLMSPSVLS